MRRIAAVFLLAGCSVAPASQSPATSDAASHDPSPRATATAAATAPSTSSTPAVEVVAWSPLTADGPSAREDHTWTVSGDGSTAYLFGGRDGDTVHGDLWAFSLRDDRWLELPSSGGPAARFGHEGLWVEGVGLVVFAGQNGPDFFSDLWAYDPERAAWRELPSTGAVPVARYGTCGAIGPDGRLWISHGFTSDGVRFSDTRAYDFPTGAWTDETPTVGELPVERCLHACWWTDDGGLALYGGQTTGVTALGDRWILGSGGWSRLDGASPPERNLYAAARVTDATLVFGGLGIDGTYLDDLWWLRDGMPDAIELTGDAGRPPGRSGASLIHDPGAGRFLLFGGRNDEGALADLWELHVPPAPGG
jgi:hypothetical protein